MRDYTLSETIASAHTINIPAFGGKLDLSWNPESQVTQWGRLAYFVSYLKTSGLFDRLVEDAPFHYTIPNAPEVRDVVGSAVLTIICGFTRYVHINRLRNDTVLATLLGLGRIVSEDSVRRALKAADEQELNAWLAQHEKLDQSVFHLEWMCNRESDTREVAVCRVFEKSSITFPMKRNRASYGET